MHVFPQLRKLERKYARELVVVGVHSAKFSSEKETENLREAVERYELEHPVVNDRDFAIWEQYGVRAWPTLIFVDPDGRVLGAREGEATFEELDKLVSELALRFEARGLLQRETLSIYRPNRQSEGALCYPGKVLGSAEAGLLFIADSNHNRILVTTLDGVVREVIGSGKMGLADGDFATAQFNHPQGMALADRILYVADTENHALRSVDLDTRTVTTLAGTGQQAPQFHQGGPGRKTALSSPWDLVVAKETLYVAMAGFHQLWALNLITGEVRPHAGSGREGIMDGPLPRAWLAQPSGITTDGQALYFADSETSSIRQADLSPDGRVSTIVGLDLFVYGDVDGVGEAVRLQHPLGVTYYDGALYVADSYNNKIKRVLPRTRGCLTLLGEGPPGHLDGDGRQAQFHEPGGLSVAEGKVYIADTNNHAIRVADLATLEVRTLEVRLS